MTNKQNAPAVQIDPASWESGYNAGLTGKPGRLPEGKDGLSFFSGLIEGKADRSKPAEQRKPHTRPEKPTP